MAISTIINDGAGINGSARVLKKADLSPGIMVYTEPVRTSSYLSTPAINPQYGTEMARDARFSGTPDVIHNGTDTVAWTGSNLSGTNFVFDSTAFAQAGTKSISGAATVNNNEALLSRSSALTVASYVGITGYIYITAWGASSNVSITARLAGAVVSSTISLSNYVSGATLNSWQKFSIPLSAFNFSSSTFDQLVIRTIGTGSSTPDYYLDTLQVEESGGSSTYYITPPAGSIYRVSSITLSLVDAYDSTLASNSLPKISYNKLLGVSALTTGIQSTIVSEGVESPSEFFKQHLDIIRLPDSTFSAGADATNTWAVYQINFNPGLLLDARQGDSISLTISEDLSGLISLYARASGAVQYLP